MSRFTIHHTPLKGLVILERQVKIDSRGAFERMFCSDDLREILKTKEIKQINRSLTKMKGAIRGMHFQHSPHQEMKFVSCLKGEVFDVAIDLRKESPTFLKWHGHILSETNAMTMVIPEGFAHGFQTLTEDCELLYLHTASFESSSEGALKFDDPLISIKWPLSVTEISDRDKGHIHLTDTFKGI